MISTAYILLGSNLGEREKYLSSAIAMIKEISGLRLSGNSSVYSSPAQQMASGTPPFLNQAIKVDTSLSPPNKRISRSIVRESCFLLSVLPSACSIFSRAVNSSKDESEVSTFIA